MKALSLLQPWAWVMVDYRGPDPKRIENRRWPTKFRGEFLIHASLGYDWKGHRWIERETGITLPDSGTLKRGGFVGMASCVDCVTSHASRWFFGPYGFVLAEKVRSFPFEPCKGALGFWEYPLDAMGQSIVFGRAVRKALLEGLR